MSRHGYQLTYANKHDSENSTKIFALASMEDSTAKGSFYKGNDDNNRVTMMVVAITILDRVQTSEIQAEKMEMVPRKRRGLGFLKKLLFKRKRVSVKECLALTM